MKVLKSSQQHNLNSNTSETTFSTKRRLFKNVAISALIAFCFLSVIAIKILWDKKTVQEQVQQKEDLAVYLTDYQNDTEPQTLISLPETDSNTDVAIVPEEGVICPCPTVELDAATRKMYAETLRNLLIHNILPDGQIVSRPGDQSTFFIGDVDTDGKEELVLFYDPGVIAGMAGYILGYDENEKSIHIQLSDFPYFEFLRNGNIKALCSHNQTDGKMWPFTLYQYRLDNDSYEVKGFVWSEDESVMEAAGRKKDFPTEADVSHSGTVYYLSKQKNWSTTPVDKSVYISWLQKNNGDCEEMQVTFLQLTEENIFIKENEVTPPSLEWGNALGNS